MSIERRASATSHGGQERGYRTRKAIIQGAAIAFEKQGYDATTWLDIEKNSGISQGATYFHFKSKEQIALAVMQEQHNRMFAATEEMRSARPDPIERLIWISSQACNLMRDDIVVRAGITLALGQGALRDESAKSYEAWTRGVAPMLQTAVDEGLILSNLTADDLAQSLVAHFTGIQLMSQALTLRQDLSTRAQAMWRIFLDAAMTPAEVDHYWNHVCEAFS